MADFQKVQQFIGGMAGEGYKPTDSLILSMMSASVNKLWIWGEVESAYAVREFYSQVNEFYHAALAKALPIHKARALMAKVSSQAAQKESEKVRLEQELRAHHLVPLERRDEQWEIDANRLDQQSLMVAREAAEQRRVVAGMDFGISIKADEFLDFLIEQQTTLMDQINVVMRLARADIGMEGDVKKLEEQSHEMSKRATAAVKKLKEDFQKEAESLQHLFR